MGSVTMPRLSRLAREGVRARRFERAESGDAGRGIPIEDEKPEPQAAVGIGQETSLAGSVTTGAVSGVAEAIAGGAAAVESDGVAAKNAALRAMASPRPTAPGMIPSRHRWR
jgi:hypothetical protein